MAAKRNLYERRIKFVEINCKNLRDPDKPIYQGRGYTAEEYEKKLDLLVHRAERAIEGAKYFALGLIEIWDMNALNDFVARLKRKATVVAPAVDGTGAHVALVTNCDVIKSRLVTKISKTGRIDEKDVRIVAETYSRPVLATKLSVEGTEIEVWVFHLKSKLPRFAGDESEKDQFDQPKGKARALAQRTAEAIGLRQMYVAEKRKVDRPYVMMGDGNDSWDAITTTMFTGEPLWDGAEDKDKAANDRFRLFDVVTSFERKTLLKGKYHTYIHEGVPSRIDVIYVSQDLIAGKKARVDNARVFNDHLIDTTVTTEYSPRWEMDHGLISVSVLLEE